MPVHDFKRDPLDPDYCMCGLHRTDPDHPQAKQPPAAPTSDPEVVALRKQIELLLGNVGDFATCTGCQRGIYWVRHKNGKKAPYDLDGVNHFVTCPQAHEFRRRSAL